MSLPSQGNEEASDTAVSSDDTGNWLSDMEFPLYNFQDQDEHVIEVDRSS